VGFLHGGVEQATLEVHAMPRQMTYHSILTAEPRHWLQAIQFLAARQKVYPIEEIISAKLYTGPGHPGHGVVPHPQGGQLPAQLDRRRAPDCELGLVVDDGGQAACYRLALPSGLPVSVRGSGSAELLATGVWAPVE
jgi:hypothetical protein